MATIGNDMLPQYTHQAPLANVLAARTADSIHHIHESETNQRANHYAQPLPDGKIEDSALKSIREANRPKRQSSGRLVPIRTNRKGPATLAVPPTGMADV